jgi:hypothetical protein
MGVHILYCVQASWPVAQISFVEERLCTLELRGNVVILFVSEVIRTHNSGLGEYMIPFTNLYHFLRCVKFVVGLYLSTSRTMLIYLMLDFVLNSSPIKKGTVLFS